MTKQLNILELIEEGERLKEAGLNLAVDHADRESEKWSKRVYDLFKEWLSRKPMNYQFMTEDFRRETREDIDQPPSLRAFGFICPKACKEKLIVFVSNEKTKNSKAHRTPAGLWMKILLEQ